MEEDINKVVEEILSNKRTIDQLGNLSELDKQRLKKLLIETEGDQEQEELKEFECYGDKVTKIRLIQRKEDLMMQSIWFPLEYTNQVYREDEKIIGYKDLEICLNFLGGSLIPFIQINYEQKTNNADNIYEMLNKVFLNGYLTKYEEFERLIEKEGEFKPNGKFITSFEKNSEQYEIYFYDIFIENFEEYKKKMQVFLLFYIDGASFVECSEFWKYLIVFKIDKNMKYNFVGFLSYYVFYQSYERCRYRLSQILLLPLFQRKGIGFELLSAFYKLAQEDKKCFEITVEECSEEFQGLRDYKDIKMILDNEMLKYQPINTIQQLIDQQPKKDIVKNISKTLKIISTQVYRACEILLLCQIDQKNAAIMKEFEKIVKERIRAMNQTELMPFQFKKYPIIIFDNQRQSYNCEDMFKRKAPQEINAILQNSYDDLFINYDKLSKKIQTSYESK